MRWDRKISFLALVQSDSFWESSGMYKVIKPPSVDLPLALSHTCILCFPPHSKLKFQILSYREDLCLLLLGIIGCPWRPTWGSPFTWQSQHKLLNWRGSRVIPVLQWHLLPQLAFSKCSLFPLFCFFFFLFLPVCTLKFVLSFFCKPIIVLKMYLFLFWSIFSFVLPTVLFRIYNLPCCRNRIIFAF